MIKIYLARSMSGRIKSEVVTQAQQDKSLLEAFGFKVLCPVSSEGVEPTSDILLSNKAQMDFYWKRDKEMIRQAHVVFIMSPHLPSMGVIREYGYSRYFLWKKTITIFPEGKIPPEGNICHYEDDLVTDNIFVAMKEAIRTHGTYWRRLKWRISLYQRCVLKAWWYKLQEWIK